MRMIAVTALLASLSAFAHSAQAGQMNDGKKYADGMALPTGQGCVPQGCHDR